MKNSRLLLLHVTFTIKLFVTFVTFYDYCNWRPKVTKTCLIVQVFFSIVGFDTTVETHHFNIYLIKHSIIMSVGTSIQEQRKKRN